MKMNKYTFKGTYYGKTVFFDKCAFSLREAWQQIEDDQRFDEDSEPHDVEDIQLVYANTVTYSGVIPELGITHCTMDTREAVEKIMKECYENSSLKFHYIIIKNTPQTEEVK